jgi:hypothetical protein
MFDFFLSLCLFSVLLENFDGKFVFVSLFFVKNEILKFSSLLFKI